MRTSIITSVLALAASQVAAQDNYYSNQSAPFSLVVSSSNSSINGGILYACHEGAAIEGLCLGGASFFNTSSAIYNLNYSSQVTPDPVLGITGLLTWVLHGGNFNLSSPMQLSSTPTSNVGIPLFEPGGDDGTFVGFDKENKMFIGGYEDDTVSPIKYETKAYYRWFICTTQPTSYVYTTLAWVYGVHSHPQNPTCQKVDVIRQFL